MKYTQPQTTYVRAAAVNVAKPSAMDKNPAPRIVPDIGEFLQSQIAGCIQIPQAEKASVPLWYLMFAWPTHEETQDKIYAELGKLLLDAKCSGLWRFADDLPTENVTVTEYVPDETKPPVAGVKPTKPVQVTKPLADHCAKFLYVGEAARVAKPVEKPLGEVVRK